MIIPVSNNLTDYSTAKSYLSEDESSGAGTIRVKNIAGFTKQYAIQLGKTGDEETEIVVLANTAVAGTGLDVSGTIAYDHGADTPVYQIKYDQIVFKKSSSGTAGTATAITDGTVSITPDGTVTVFDDTSGVSTDAYKTSFYNSAIGTASSDSDWITPTGHDFYSLASLRKRVLDKLPNKNFLENETVIDDWLNEWLEQMTNAAVKVNEGYSMGSTDVSFGTSGLGTVTDSDFKTVKKFEITYNGGDSWSKATRKEVDEFERNEQFSSEAPVYGWMDDDVFFVRPYGTAGTASIIYSRLQTKMTDEGDLLPLPMRGYTRSFVNYALGQAQFKDEKQSDVLKAEAERDKAQFVTEITPRDTDGAKFIRLDVEPTAEDLEGIVF